MLQLSNKSFLAIDVAHEMERNFEDIQSSIEWVKDNTSALKAKLFPLLFRELEAIIQKTEIKKEKANGKVEQ
jgi:hypothetical protein